jgi:hypothetical protein
MKLYYTLFNFNDAMKILKQLMSNKFFITVFLQT